MRQIHAYPLSKDFYNLLDDFENFEKISKNWNKSQSILNLDKKIKFLKTHHILCSINNNFFTTYKNSLGVIYIVRDPRNVITSLKNHYNFKDYDDALKFLLNDKNIIGVKNSKREVDLPHIISSWKNHFNSWKKMNKNYLLIKYENLINFPELEFEKITNYLENLINRKFEKTKIFDAIKNCSFDNLKKMEKLHGFIEAPVSTDRTISFFNMGPKNDWRKLIDKKISKKIEEEFKKEMTELFSSKFQDE